MLTKVQNPKHYAVPYNKEVAKKDVISIIDDEGFLREVSFSDLTDHPTTISGYGITDAYISNGTIYLGNESITPASVSSLGTAAYKDYTTSVTQGGADLPTSDAVFQAIGAAVSSALHYRGISSTVITDGGTETAVIGGQPLIAQSGDVVIYSGFEFLWENNVWNKLGDDTSFALKTVQITGDGIYIIGGGDLTTSRSLGLSQAAIDALALASTAVQPTALDAYLPLAGNSVATKITGSVILGNAKYLQGVKNDDTSSVNLLGINSSNNIHVGNTSCNLYLDSGSADIYHYKAGTSYRIYDADNLTLRTLAGSSAIGSSTQPVYYNGSSLAACDLSTTYAPYDANGYLPLTAGSGKALTGNLYINTTEPSIYGKIDNAYQKLYGFSQGGNMTIFPDSITLGKNLYVKGKTIQFDIEDSTNDYTIYYEKNGFYPYTTNKLNLGTAYRKWASFHSMSANLYGDLTFDATSADRSIKWTNSSNVTAAALSMHANGNITIGYNQITNGKTTYIYGGNITMSFGSSSAIKKLVFANGVVRPNTNNEVSLGMDAFRFTNVYATNLFGSLALSNITGADDLKAIEALTETSGFLKKTAANTWSLTNDIEASSLKTSTESSPMFTFRQTPSVAVGDSLTLTKIKGNTIVWNQLMPGTQTLVGFQGSCALSGGVYTLTGSNNSSAYYMAYSDNIQTWVAGHKYYVSCVVDSMTLTPQFYFFLSGAYGAGRFTTTGKHSDIISVTTAATRFAIYAAKTANTDGASMSFEKVQIIDLTAEFGSGNEPTLEVFEALYNGYYSQSANRLLSLTASGLQTTGKNIWDEEWEVGEINASDGQNSSSSNAWRTKNYIPVIPGGTYYIYAVGYASGLAMRGRFYDANKNYIGYRQGNSYDMVTGQCVVPSNAYYLRFAPTISVIAAGTKICVSKYDASFNGQYEPYKSNVARLDITTLKVKSPNIWDEEWEVGAYNNSGEPASTSNIRTKNPIPVLPNTKYYLANTGATAYPRVFFYDTNDAFISREAFSVNGKEITTPANCAYLRFFMADTYGTTYRNDICLNISNPAFNGKYFSHLPFAPYADGMKDAGTAYDELRSKSTTRRMAKVDLGTLTWNYSSANGFWARITAMKPQQAGMTLNVVCPNYVGLNVNYSTWTASDKALYLIPRSISSSYADCIFIKDSAYTDAATFKTAVNGVELIYEQAYPEDFELITPLSLMIPSDALGTQRLLPENGAVPTTAPIIADIQYGANIGDVVNEVDTRFTKVNNAIADILTQLPSSGKAEIPTEAPANPDNTKTYIYYDDVNHKICVREKDGTVYSIQLST